MMSAAVFTSLLVCAAGTAAILPDPRAQEATGTLRILVIRATWGPKPEASWTPSPFADAAALYARSSFGKLRLAVEVTPWLVAYREPICPGEATPSSVFGRLGDDAQDAARGAGFDAATFARVVYVLPDRVCGFGGLGVGREVLLASAGGILDAIAFAHELGHTFGLPHANGSSCARGCRVFEYGDPLSPMGGGSTDFTALEKLKLRWISRVERGTRNGTYTVADIDAPSERPQALVVETAPAEFWLEHRRAEPAGHRARRPSERSRASGLSPDAVSVTDGQPVCRKRHLSRDAHGRGHVCVRVARPQAADGATTRPAGEHARGRPCIRLVAART
jgi:hypothetical protein